MRAALLVLLVGCTSADPHERVACEAPWSQNPGSQTVSTCEAGCELHPVVTTALNAPIACMGAVSGSCRPTDFVTFDGMAGCCRVRYAGANADIDYVQFVECNQ